MTTPIIARADALIQRGRGTPAAVEDPPMLTDAIEEDSELPLLLDAVAAEVPAPAAPQPTDADAADSGTETDGRADHDEIDPVLRDRFIRDVASRIEERLLAELPTIVEAAVVQVLAEIEREQSQE